jgi:EXPERA (EXPanded EBP superfamily)
MEALKGPLRAAYLGFFASHIVFTILVDGQALLPTACYPKPVRQLVEWYAGTLSDPLMSRPRTLLWFQSLIATELVFQLPFFVYACHTIYTQTSLYSDTFRCAAIAYGASTATTLVPILATVMWAPSYPASADIAATSADSDKSLTPSLQQRAMLTLVYLPYLILPAYLAWYAASRPSNSAKKTV